MNAGAIATVSLVPAKSATEKWNKILAFYSAAAGEPLKLIDEVYKSEAATNQGNRALAALLLKYERIYAGPLESVDVYTKQCSVGVNTKELGMMGATLANSGKNPVTGKQVIKAESIPHLLSTMTVAGLYRWLRDLGMECRPSGKKRRRRRHCGNNSGSGRNLCVFSPVGRGRQQRQSPGGY